MTSAPLDSAQLPFRVHHFNTYVTGGAATAARRLHDALRKRGIDSRFYYGAAAEPAPDPSYKLIRWCAGGPHPARWSHLWRAWCRRRLQRFQLKRYLRGRPAGLEMFSSPRRPGPTVWPVAQDQLAIVHLHWIAGLIDWPTFFDSLPPGTPVVWTLHDMNPFTGGCHYSGTCRQFETGCVDCPQLSPRTRRDLAAKFFTVKQRALERLNLHVVAPSRWLAGEADSSLIFRAAQSVRVIPYGIDTSLFRPIDRATARRHLELPPSILAIGFGAESIGNRRKGLAELIEALGRLRSDSRWMAIVFGRGTSEDFPTTRLPIRHVGYTGDVRRMAEVYSACDVFVLPSLEENLGQTGLEAMACGTPVVGFSVGGNPDFILHHRTGMLARPHDPTDLARCLQWLLDHDEQRLQFGHNARRLVESQFQDQRQAVRYERLYRELLAETQRYATRAA